MYRRLLPVIGISLLGFAGTLGLICRPQSHRVTSPVSPILIPSAVAAIRPYRPSPLRSQLQLPLIFERNQGQANRRARFLSHSGDSTLFLTPTEAVFMMAERKSAPLPIEDKRGRAQTPQALTSLSALRMQLVGANGRASAVEEQPLAGRINYFIGHDPGKWHAGVPTFGRARFAHVYPGVDVVYYGNQQHLEYDFLVAPYADPTRIKLHFAGAQTVRVNRAGDLLVGMQGKTLRWQKPIVYQEGDSGKRTVAGRFRLEHSGGQTQVGFALGRYDSGRRLIIDPVLVYSTYLSGTNYDFCKAIAVDSQGSAYVTGYTYSTDFPVTAGAFQTTNRLSGGVSNVFVTKLNPTGTALIYSTYLGGTGNDNNAAAIAVDSQGSAYVTGFTSSTDFPVTSGAFQTMKKAPGTYPNAFVTKLNPSGAALIYSTYLGGTGYEGAGGIAVDSQGNTYVTGSTNSTDFPVTPGAFQTTNHASRPDNNAYVTKINPTGTALIYSTYLGGTNYSYANGIAVDSQGSAYVAGYTTSTDFPVTPGAFQTTNRVSRPAKNSFVTRLNTSGTALIYSTYLGGSGYDNDATAIAVDSQGNAYVAGYTTSTDFPVTPGAFQTTNRAPSPDKNGFVTKLNTSGTALLYSTYLGGSIPNGDNATPGSRCTAIAVDSQGGAYVTGYTNSADFPVTSGAFQTTNNATGGNNAFVTRFDVTGAALIYSTYLGGAAYDNATAIALDIQGNAYVAGYTNSTDFPTTPGAFQTTSKSGTGNHAFVTRLSNVAIYRDFNGDGMTDLLIQNQTTGQISAWLMNGPQRIGGFSLNTVPPASYDVVGAGDFTGTGFTDLALQDRNNGTVALWYTIGSNVFYGQFVAARPLPGWKVIGVGDFNGDGKSDLVFQSKDTGQIVLWFMNGATYLGGVLVPQVFPPDWRAVGVGDFNGDGMPDIVFQSQITNQVAFWYMRRSTLAGTAFVSTIPAPGYKVVGTGDFNGDGFADLIFQNQATTQSAIWYMRQTSFLGGAMVSPTIPAGWKIVGPR